MGSCGCQKKKRKKRVAVNMILDCFVVGGEVFKAST